MGLMSLCSMTTQRQSDSRTAFVLLSLWLVLLFLAMPVRMFCETEKNSLKNRYVRTRFGTEQGLFVDLVDDIVQSRDGFLWLRENGSGISRFDGQHFVSTTSLGTVQTLAAAPNGDLWVGTSEDLKQIRENDLGRFGKSPFVIFSFGPHNGVTALHFTRDGVLWIGTKKGLYRSENGSFAPVMQGPYIQRIDERANGQLWVMTGDGPMQWDGRRVVPHPELASELGVNAKDIFHVFEDSHGVTWLCTSYGVARHVSGAMEKLEPWGPKGYQKLQGYEDPRGRIWFAMQQGLFQLTAHGLELVAAGMQVRGMFGDRDGNLWVGTNGDGLYRFRDAVARGYTTADGLPSNIAMTVLTAHDGSLWAGFNCAGLAHFQSHGIRTYNEKDGLLNACVWSLAEDAKRDLWVGTWGGGLFQFHQGKFIQYSKRQGLQSDEVRGVLAAHDGSLWLSCGGGLSQMRDGRFRNYTPADGLPDDSYYDLYEDQAGGIWANSYHGTEHLLGDRFESFSASGRDTTDVIGNDLAGSIYLREGSRDGPFRLYRVDRNRPVLVASKVMAGILRETGQRDLWMFSSLGILRFPPGSLSHLHAQDEPLDFERFDLLDGLPATQSSGGLPVSALTPDGKLWIATLKGLASVDLSRVTPTDLRPSIYVERLTIGRNTEDAPQEAVLEAGTHHLELDFDAIEVTSPKKVRLQYRMDGVDSEWLDASPPGHAVYSTLPPGKHAFHMRACNRSGIWDRAGSVYYVTQQPYFYQTSWFLACCIALGLLLIVALYQIRVHQAVTNANMRAEERENERTRIARELHDTLLQTLHGLMFQFQAVRNLMSRRPDEAMKTLDDAINETEKALSESRDAIHGLRSEPIAEGNLSELLMATSQELSRPGTSNHQPPAFELIEEGERRTLSATIKNEVCRIAREILRNAYRHAEAHRIETEIRYGNHTLRLRIRDDGKGIDPTVLKEGGIAGHWGLRGIRERAERIGGQLEFWSERGAGTEVQLSVPASVAYETSGADVGFGLLRKIKNRVQHS
jgi:signal transduction histidine kinase/ligand-binding sensor domain-containing protein